ncbi:MAG: sigma-70 family RNA polymerase sigma factor [Polyangiaceae bacterium]|nr:sigma-70 family RNA polymerase sigma factor [Polyangiaceae bacterium]
MQRLSSDQQRLIVEGNVVNSAMRRHRRDRWGDISGAAALGACSAAAKFDPGRGVRFDKFARKVVDREVHRARRADARQPRPAEAVDADELAGDVAGPSVMGDATLSASRGSEDVVAGRIDAKVALTALVATLAELPAILRRVLELHYDEALSYPEIAEVLGISYSTARRYHERALVFCRERMARPQNGGRGGRCY